MSKEPKGRVPLEDVPVFPLPGVVLLPEQRLPLHIFEPRYRAMVRDTLEGHGHLVVARIPEGETGDTPRFEHVATLGRITTHQKLPDGRFNILVEGVVRVALDELPFVAPYRRAHATLLGDARSEMAEIAAPLRASLLSVMTLVMRQARAKQSRLDFEPPLDLPTPRLALRLVDRFVTSATLRQSVLDAEDTTLRVLRATSALAEVLAEPGAKLSAVGSG